MLLCSLYRAFISVLIVGILLIFAGNRFHSIGDGDETTEIKRVQRVDSRSEYGKQQDTQKNDSEIHTSHGGLRYGKV